MTLAVVAPALGNERGSEPRQSHRPPPFQPHQARYDVSRNGSTLGRLHATLRQRDDGLWHYRIESETTAWYARMLGASTLETAWFDWRDDWQVTGRDHPVVALTYHHVAERTGRDRFWQHEYDWDGLRTSTRTHEGDSTIELQPGAVDPLTLRLAAAARIGSDDGAGTDFEFPVVERDEIEVQQYRFQRHERLEILGRCLDTSVYYRFRREGSSRNYRAWHAEALGWLPARIVHEDDGDTIAIELTDWTPAPPISDEPGTCD